MNIGYARVSTQDQRLDMQISALQSVGCEKIYQEKISGSRKDRPELERMISTLRKGDTVYVYKLDRLGRSLKHLIQLVDLFQSTGVSLVSISDSINTSNAQGRFFIGVFAALAEFEREIIRERTMSGLEAARARGRKGGRPKGLSTEAEHKAIAAATLYKEGTLGVDEIINQLSISKSTLYKYLRHRGVKIGK